MFISTTAIIAVLILLFIAWNRNSKLELQIRELEEKLESANYIKSELADDFKVEEGKARRAHDSLYHLTLHIAREVNKSGISDAAVMALCDLDARINECIHYVDYPETFPHPWEEGKL